MTKEKDQYPIPEVRFLVARNWRARIGLGAIILLAIYLLSALVSLSQSNQELNRRNNLLVKQAADASILEAKKTADLLSIISKLDAQITLLGGVTPAPIKEQLKDVLMEDQGSNGSGEPANESRPTFRVDPILPFPTTTTVAEGQGTTTTTEAVTTTTGRATTTTTRFFPPTTSTTRPKRVCVINEAVCVGADLRFKRAGRLVVYPRLD